MNPLAHETSSPDDGTMFWSKVELWIGAALAGLGALLLVMWWTGRGADRHGMIFVFLGGAFVLPFGVSFLLAGVGLRLRRPGRWFGQLLPLLWPLTYFAFFKWRLLP